MPTDPAQLTEIISALLSNQKRLKADLAQLTTEIDSAWDRGDESKFQECFEKLQALAK